MVDSIFKCKQQPFKCIFTTKLPSNGVCVCVCMCWQSTFKQGTKP